MPSTWTHLQTSSCPEFHSVRTGKCLRSTLGKSDLWRRALWFPVISDGGAFSRSRLAGSQLKKNKNKTDQMGHVQFLVGRGAAPYSRSKCFTSQHAQLRPVEPGEERGGGFRKDFRGEKTTNKVLMPLWNKLQELWNMNNLWAFVYEPDRV